VPLTLQELNAADQNAFRASLDGIYPGAPWVAERAATKRPFASLAQLRRVLVEVVRAAGREAQLALLREGQTASGPQALAHEGRARSGPVPGPVGVDDDDDAAAVAALRELDAGYLAKFGFPFRLAARGPRAQALTLPEIVATLRRRIAGHPELEFAEALRQAHRDAELRLNRLLGEEPELGNRIWDWAEELAIHSDPGFAERGQLTVTYLTDAHRACAARLSAWMTECGFDEVEIDAVGNVIGLYHANTPEAKRLLTGSHYDTVRNGGKYDGRLGVLVPMACVRELHRQRRRLPFAIELVAFAEEEGQRYKATFLGSGALLGQFDPAWLDQVDAQGVSMRDAMREAGLPGDPSAIATLARDPARYLGFVEVHIEQGPVLADLDLPLGVVTSINGGLRFLGEIVGLASHAGTTPMGARRDAAAAAAELALYLEQRASAQPELVGTMGLLEVPGGSINVVPGRCRFSLDIRATTDPVRDACADDVRARLREICARRGVGFTLEETLRVPAAPSDPAWMRRWERAVDSLGLPVHRMPSGAGHDAMKLHELMPQAMLFVRGLNSGISHNPLESITSDDADLAARAFRQLLEDLAAEKP